MKATLGGFLTGFGLCLIMIPEISRRFVGQTLNRVLDHLMREQVGNVDWHQIQLIIQEAVNTFNSLRSTYLYFGISIGCILVVIGLYLIVKNRKDVKKHFIKALKES